MQYAIEAENLVKKYGQSVALDGVTLKVKQGEIFGFLGPNGAGKSTFVKILLNLIFPSQGSSLLFGIPSHTVSARKSVGFLPENMRVYHFLTVEEFCKFQADLAGVQRYNVYNDIERCLDLSGFGHERKKRLGTLSKGMLQKVGIAQAMLGSPRLLLLDEPTSGLDPVGIKELRGVLHSLKEKGTTIFLNSHLLSEIERTCDRIAILHKGKIIKEGCTNELTHQSKHLEVVTEGINETMLNKINSMCSKDLETSGNILRIYPRVEEDTLSIHRIIDENGGRLRSLCWKGETLEETFYRLVKNK